jgi:thymidylate kinase
MENNLQQSPPDVLLILGMDGSGKNHLANLTSDYIMSLGFAVEKREGKLAGKTTEAVSSEDKSWKELLAEKIFIWSFSYLKFTIPFLVYLLIDRDLRQFRKSERKKTIVISHTAIRLLAFYLGHIYQDSAQIILPKYLEKKLYLMTKQTKVKTIVLDIENQIRRQRIAAREAKGKIDNMDRYMADPKHIELSERIEDFLVWIALKYLQAFKIDNNDLSDLALINEIEKAFQQFAS